MATAERRSIAAGRRRRAWPYRLSLEQYHRMAEAGILTKRDKVVLLDGVLCETMTKGNLHIATVNLVIEAFRAILPDGYRVAKEDPIALPGGPWGGDSEPEPDVSILRGGIRDYLDRKPGPADVAMVVEVADSSLAEDREQLVRYAWAGIPVAWLINLRSRTVEVYTDPTGPSDDPRYARVETVAEDGRLSVVVGGRECGTVAVREILP